MVKNNNRLIYSSFFIVLLSVRNSITGTPSNKLNMYPPNKNLYSQIYTLYTIEEATIVIDEHNKSNL